MEQCVKGKKGPECKTLQLVISGPNSLASHARKRTQVQAGKLTKKFSTIDTRFMGIRQISEHAYVLLVD